MKVLSLILGIGLLSTTAQAGNMTFQFINPNFVVTRITAFRFRKPLHRIHIKIPDAHDWGSGATATLHWIISPQQFSRSCWAA